MKKLDLVVPEVLEMFGNRRYKSYIDLAVNLAVYYDSLDSYSRLHFVEFVLEKWAGSEVLPAFGEPVLLMENINPEDFYQYINKWVLPIREAMFANLISSRPVGFLSHELFIFLEKGNDLFERVGIFINILASGFCPYEEIREFLLVLRGESVDCSKKIGAVAFAPDFRKIVASQLFLTRCDEEVSRDSALKISQAFVEDAVLEMITNIKISRMSNAPIFKAGHILACLIG